MKKTSFRNSHPRERNPPIREPRPSGLTHNDIRLKASHYCSKVREIEISSLKRDYLALSAICRLDSEIPSGNLEELLESLSLPPDFRKVVDHLGTCSSKMRRIARRCIFMWGSFDSREYLALLRESFFNPDSSLRQEPLDDLFSVFHSRLMMSAHRARAEGGYWIPWEDVMKKLARE